MNKCYFAKPQIEYLGHVMSTRAIAPDATKKQAMFQWKSLSNQKQLTRFLGLIDYYRKFVPYYTSITTSLTTLLLQHFSKKILSVGLMTPNMPFKP